MEQLTSSQVSEWEVYFRLEPFGEERADFRTAQQSSVFVNVMKQIYGEEKKQKKWTQPTDFMPEWDKVSEEEEEQTDGELQKKPAAKQSVSQMKQILKTIAQVKGDKNKKKKQPPKKKRK